jgi:GH15 family glucan-1,4-alpha-glucosidase
VSARPRIEDYALVADGHTGALIHRGGSVDWYCPKRLDAGSVFGRLLDLDRGGHLALAPPQPSAEPERDYLEGTLVLCTTWTARGGRARVLDLMTVDREDPAVSRRQLVRVVEGLDGEVEFEAEVVPRFDYGEATPWLYDAPDGTHYALAGNDALIVACADRLARDGPYALHGRFTVSAGERVRLEVRDIAPESLDGDDRPRPCPPEELDRRVDNTIAWWRDWSGQARLPETDRAGVLRSALVLKALTNPRTGAMAAALTTSLPESDEGRTWDYRYCWVRDSVFGVHALEGLGFDDAADDFRRFVQRSSAGHADQVRIVYGVGGERRMPEIELECLRGWRGIGPVRVGNAAGPQRQHDVLGQLLDLTWYWHVRGRAPDDDLWAFVCELVERAARDWREPDRGLWEWRDGPRHFTHSKVMCWVALDRGVRLATELDRDAPVERWSAARDELRAAIEDRAYDPQQGVFTQTFGDLELDAALLRLSAVGYLDPADERMVRTADAIAARLGEDGLVRRYRVDDDQPGREGAFLPCAFWLVECLAAQGRVDEARERFERALQTRNDVGLFSEEHDVEAGEARGNVPQALTHLSHVLAALALERSAR